MTNHTEPTVTQWAATLGACAAIVVWTLCAPYLLAALNLSEPLHQSLLLSGVALVLGMIGVSIDLRRQRSTTRK